MRQTSGLIISTNIRIMFMLSEYFCYIHKISLHVAVTPLSFFRRWEHRMAAITDRLGNRRLFLLTDPSQVMNMFVELFKIQVTELEMFQNPRLIAPTVLPRPFVDVFTRFHPKSGDRKGVMAPKPPFKLPEYLCIWERGAEATAPDTIP